MKNSWKSAGWIFHPDNRKADARTRKKRRNRHRKDHPLRKQRIWKPCPTCVEQGLAKPCKAQTDAWCQGLCKKHAREKGYQNCKQKGAAKKDGKCTSKRRRTAVASPKRDEQDLEDRASEVSDSQRTTLGDVDFDKDTNDNGQDLEDEEADEGADGKERIESAQQANTEKDSKKKVKKVPKTKEKPNLRKLGMEKNNNTKAERQWPKGVRICLGPLPLQRTPTRERCQGGNFQARATQQNCARARAMLRNGCGNILCDECYA
jgi:hypothetical protein